jgi:hypothetical protein
MIDYDELRHLLESKRDVIQTRVEPKGNVNLMEVDEFELGYLGGLNEAIKIVNERSIQELNELLAFFN